jgi:predicted amidohydrolase
LVADLAGDVLTSRASYDRSVRGRLRVGACQTPEILGDIGSALLCIEDFATEAAAQGVHLLLFPECFLQGYLVEEQHVGEHSLSLDSARFTHAGTTAKAKRHSDAGPADTRRTLT